MHTLMQAIGISMQSTDVWSNSKLSPIAVQTQTQLKLLIEYGSD